MTEVKRLNSVGKAVKLVEFLAAAPPQGAALTEITDCLGINKATAHHTLSALKEHGWVMQNADTNKYRLGYGLTLISKYFLNQDRLVAELHPALEQIGAQINELVHLGILCGDQIMYLDKVSPQHTIQVISRIGRQTPACTTALGRALLAAKQLPESELQALWEQNVAEINAQHKARLGASKAKTAPQSPATPPRRKNTRPIKPGQLDPATGVNCDWETFLASIKHAETHGWAAENEENEPHITCVAIPLYIHGTPSLAISVTVPVDRINRPKQATILHTIAQQIDQLPADLAISLPAHLKLPKIPSSSS